MIRFLGLAAFGLLAFPAGVYGVLWLQGATGWPQERSARQAPPWEPKPTWGQPLTR